MNYTELKANVNDICEQTFTDDQLAMFTKQAEQKIYTTVSLPALRKNQTGSLTSGNKYLTMPSGFLYAYSLAIIDNSGEYTYLLDKDVNFIREAYPNPAAGGPTVGTPIYYAIFDETSFIVGPTPNTDFDVEIHFAYYPESIVTAGTSWLGTEFDSALLNGTLVEAIRFQKGEPDMVALYDNMYAQSLALLKNLGDGKLREDTYRGGQVKVETA